MDAAKARHDAYVSSLQGFLDVVTATVPSSIRHAEEPETKTTDAQAIPGRRSEGGDLFGYAGLTGRTVSQMKDL